MSNNKIQLNNNDLQKILDDINNLPDYEPGIDTTDATAVAADILKDKTAYVQGQKVTGTIETKTNNDITQLANVITVPTGYYAKNETKEIPLAEVNSSDITVSNTGLITATITKTAGYDNGTAAQVTEQLSTQGAKTITPTKSSQTAVAAQKYTTGTVTVGAIPDEYITTTDANAIAGDIMEGQTAYVDGAKLTGTFTLDSESSAQDTLISNTKTALAGKASAIPVLQNKTVAPSTSQQVVSADSGYDGLKQVTVSAMRLQDKTITENGEYTADSGYDGLGTISVNVEGSGGGTFETCTVTVSTNNDFEIIYVTIDENNSLITTHTEERILTVVCGSYIYIPVVSTMPNYTSSSDNIWYSGDLSGYSSHRTMVFKIVANAGEAITINCFDDD